MNKNYWFIILFIVLSGCVDKNLYHRKGIEAFKEGNHRAAIDLFNKALADKSAKADELYLYKGMSYFRLNSLDSALNNYQKAIFHNSNNSETHNEIGFLLQNNGDFEQSIEFFSNAIRLNDSRAEFYNNRGFSYYSLLKYNNALNDYKRAISIDKNYSFAYNGAGVTFVETGDFNEAILYLSKAIDKRPDYLEAYFNRAQARVHLGKLDEAFHDLEYALKLDVDFMHAYYLRGLIFWGLEDTLRTCNDFRKILGENYSFADSIYHKVCDNYN